MHRHASASKRRQEGTVLIYTTLGLLAFFGLAALATDTGFTFNARAQLQNATDAAALAAAGELLPNGGAAVDTSSALNAAQTYGNAHFAGTVAVQIPSPDVEFGSWDLAARRFTSLPGSTDPAQVRAVRVTGRRDAVANGPVPTVLGRIIGTDSIDVSTVAVAYVGFAGTFPEGVFDLPVAVDCCAIAGSDCEDFCEELARNTPIPCADDPSLSCLEFYNHGNQNACWTSFDERHRAVSAGDLREIVRQGNTFPVDSGPVYLDNGTKTSVLHSIAERFDRVGDLDGDGSGDSWVVGLPVVQCQNPGAGCAGGPPQRIEGGVCFEIRGVETSGNPKRLKGRFLCPSDPAYADCSFEGAGPGGEDFGVSATYAVLVQ